jgi:hypothetical protein
MNTAARSVHNWKAGTIVLHPAKTEWGPGKILDVAGDTLAIYFRDVPENNPGDAVKKINTNYVALLPAGSQSDPWLDNIPPFKDGKLDLGKVRLTFEQALAGFKHLFPMGFADEKYIGTRHTGERFYKWRAHEFCVEQLTGGRGQELVRQNKVAEAAHEACRVISAVNLLHVQEQIAFRDGVRDQVAARRFLSALFDLLREKHVTEAAFENYLNAILALPAFSSGDKGCTWPIATILPYLADPTRFMFLKPEVTKQAAERLAFDLNYDSHPNWRTYRKLLMMGDLLMQRLKPLGARDWIDVQSFIWVVGDK